MDHMVLGKEGRECGRTVSGKGQIPKQTTGRWAQESGQGAENALFSDVLEEKNLQGEGGEKAAIGKTAAGEDATAMHSSGRDMTLQQYECYIQYLISKMPRHPSHRQDDVMVLISKAGLEAMRRDPEYEAWVLKEVQTYFSQNQPMSSFFGKAEAVLFFGASREECYTQVRYPEYERKMERKRQEERCRERREANRKRLKKLQQKKYLQQKALKKLLEKRYLEKRWLEKKRVQDLCLEEWISEREAYETRARAASMERKLKERSLFY